MEFWDIAHIQHIGYNSFRFISKRKELVGKKTNLMEISSQMCWLYYCKIKLSKSYAKLLIINLSIRSAVLHLPNPHKIPERTQGMRTNQDAIWSLKVCCLNFRQLLTMILYSWESKAQKDHAKRILLHSGSYYWLISIMLFTRSLRTRPYCKPSSAKLCSSFRLEMVISGMNWRY